MPVEETSTQRVSESSLMRPPSRSSDDCLTAKVVSPGTCFVSKGGFSMNRLFALGVAVFFAIVGIALMGGENQAVAGHGCHGCDCAGVSCDGGCGGHHACHGCHGRRHHRCHGCHGCHGRRHHRCHGNSCCGPVADCCGAPACCEPAPVCGCEGAPVEYAPMEAPAAPVEAAPEAPPAAPAADAASFERAPMVFRQVSFRR